MAKQPRTAQKSLATSGKTYRTACPVCKAKVETHDLPADRLFPFCSRRCQLVDLGRWFDGEYSISREIEPGDIDEGEEP